MRHNVHSMVIPRCDIALGRIRSKRELRRPCRRSFSTTRRVLVEHLSQI
jgi:hypothetical protein